MDKLTTFLLFFFLSLFLVGCEGPTIQTQEGNVEAYVVNRGEVEDPTARSRNATLDGEAGVLCIEGKLYAYYSTTAGAGLEKTGEACPDVQINVQDSTSADE